jgi:hypothetical protein
VTQTPWSEDPADLSAEGTASLLRAGLKLGHLRLIVALDEQEKVSAAASLLNITQPAASRRDPYAHRQSAGAAGTLNAAGIARS